MSGAGGGAGRRKAVFLDRDGVINVRLPGDRYVTRWEEFSFHEGVAEALRLLAAAGYLLVVVTNQRGIGRGLMTEGDLEEIHRRMRLVLAREGVALDAVLHCPHDIAEGCRCRKPAPGMFEEAMRLLPIVRSGSLVVGDSETDLEAGRAAGVEGILIIPPGEECVPGRRTARSLLEAARQIVGERERGG